MSSGRGQRQGQTLFRKRFLNDLANSLVGLVQKKVDSWCINYRQPGCKSWLCCHDVLPAGALFYCEITPSWTYLEPQRQFEEKLCIKASLGGGKFQTFFMFTPDPWGRKWSSLTCAYFSTGVGSTTRFWLPEVAALLLMQLSRFIQRRDVFFRPEDFKHLCCCFLDGEKARDFKLKHLCCWRNILGSSSLSCNFISFLGYPTTLGVHMTQKELKYGMYSFVLFTAIRHDNPCPRTKPNRLGYTCCTLRSTVKRQAASV